MKKLPLLFAAFLVVSASGLRAGEPSDIHTLLRRLDGLLDRREEFLLRHEARLDRSEEHTLNSSHNRESRMPSSA